MKTLCDYPGLIGEVLRRSEQRVQRPSLVARIFRGARRPRAPRTIRYVLPGGERHYSPER